MKMRTKSRVIGGNGITANKRAVKKAITKKSAPKKAAKKLTLSKPNTYEWVDKNIYYTGNSYRVRVGNKSCYCPNKTEAIKMRKLMRSYYLGLKQDSKIKRG